MFSYRYLRWVLPPWRNRLSWSNLRHDAIAGVSGASVVIPQGVAFAAIAGLPPEMGLFTAVVPTIVAAISGSSLYAVSGPTTAISVLVMAALSTDFAVGSPQFITAAILLALIVGLIQLVLGLLRIGTALDFVSHSVMVGFISGAAIVIILSQVRELTGLRSFQSLLDGSFSQFFTDAHNGTEIATAAISFAIAVAIRKLQPALPNYLIGMIGASFFYHLVLPSEFGPETVGELSAVMPRFAAPSVTLDLIASLTPAALAIAIVGLLESGSIARALALRADVPLDTNREFVGQGLSNIAGSFFSCYPSSASFTRSGLNFDSGARTPLAAVFASVFLVAILLVAAPLMALVPMSAISGLILLIGLRLIDVVHIRRITQSSKAEGMILFVTFVFAAFIDLEFAVYVGVALSLFIFVYKTSRPFLSVGSPDPTSESRFFRPVSSSYLPECPQLVMARIEGPIYFGSVEAVRREFRRIEHERPGQKHMILVILGVGEVDLWGAELLREEAVRRKARGGSLSLQTKTPRVVELLAKFGVITELSNGRCYPSKGVAIAETIPLLVPEICRGCTSRIFRECASQPGPQQVIATHVAQGIHTAE